MTKHFIFIFTLLCSLQLHAGVQPIQKDTVQYAVRYESMELLQPLRPAYLDGVVLPMSRSGNWFVSIAGGATAFLGTPLGCEDIFGRLNRPTVLLSASGLHLGWCKDKLQRIAIQGRSIVHSKVSSHPCRLVVECPWSQICPAGTGTLGAYAFCWCRPAASCCQRT